MDIGINNRLGTARPPRGPKLLEQVRRTIRTRHYSRATEKAYIGYRVRETGYRRRHHLHPTAIQRAFREAILDRKSVV